MNVTVDLKTLRPAVSAAKKLTRRAYGNPGVTIVAAFDTLHVSASDSDVTLSLRVPATVREYGTVTVDAASLSALLKGRGSVILSDGQEGSLRVENGIASDLPTLTPVDGPTATWDAQSHKVDLSTIGEVAAAASRDECRPILTGVLFDGASIVATDSYRLHLADDAGGPFPTVLIPSRVFGFLPKTGSAYLTTGYSGGSNMVCLKTDDVFLTVRTIDGDFPNYRQLIPTAMPHSVTFEREAFFKVAGAVGATLAKSARPVRLAVEGSELVVFAHDDEGKVSSTGRVPCKGDDLDMFPAIAFNPAYLVDAVSTVRGDFVTLRVVDGLKPALVSERQEGGVNAIRLLMPVRT